MANFNYETFILKALVSPIKLDFHIVTTFALHKWQSDKIAKWEKKEDLKVAKKQGLKEPNYGAIGGHLTYSFTPTSLGTVLKITHASGAILDVTDYDSW